MLYKGGSTKQRCALKRAQRRHMGQFGSLWTKSCTRVEPQNKVVRSNVPKGAIWGTSGAYGPNRVEGWSPETTLCAQTCPKAPYGALLGPMGQIVLKGGALKQRCALKRAKGAIWGTSGAYGPNRFEGWSPETTLCAQTCSNLMRHFGVLLGMSVQGWRLRTTLPTQTCPETLIVSIWGPMERIPCGGEA
ncbi:hypothetical protein RB195_012898 [Necator americanus]|uniref:Uncharacterized protein n=1 Tax=Necator americanus TaxID=51031 RepID=A0ABR1DU98_NECAM